MKKAEKLINELSQIIPEVKEDPKAWVKFLEELVKKKPPSTMSKAFKKELHEKILSKIKEKSQAKPNANGMIWGEWLKLMFGLAGGFAVMTLIALPIFQNNPIPLILETTQDPELSPFNQEESLKNQERLNSIPFPLAPSGVEESEGEGVKSPNSDFNKVSSSNQTSLHSPNGNEATSAQVKEETSPSEYDPDFLPDPNLIHPDYIDSQNTRGEGWYRDTDGLYKLGGLGESADEGTDFQPSTSSSNFDPNLIDPDYLQYYEEVDPGDWFLDTDGLYRIKSTGGGASEDDKFVPTGDYGGTVYRLNVKPALSQIDPKYLNWESDVWLLETNGYVPESEVPSGMGGGAAPVAEETRDDVIRVPIESVQSDPPVTSSPSSEPEAPQMTYSELASIAYSTANNFLNSQGISLNEYLPTLLTSLESALQTGTAVVRFTKLDGTVIEIQVNIYSQTAQYR